MLDDRSNRDQIIQCYMGKYVHVVVDRPIGYRHGEIVYPINYGYIPGLIAGDGEEQDAYILGISEPIAEFDGQVIGGIRRMDDCEDKLVVAPLGQVYHQGEIAEAVRFQEKYFTISVESSFRKSCGVISFRRNGGDREYLILLQNNSSWSFPKGHMEAGETEEQTALRELFEETGLRARLIPEQRVLLEYDILPYTRKQVVLFFGEAEGEICLQKAEIADYRWVRADALKEFLHPDTYEACAALFRQI